MCINVGIKVQKGQSKYQFFRNIISQAVKKVTNDSQKKSVYIGLLILAPRINDELPEDL